MLALSKKLSANIPFVRVDFYEIDGRVYFGELTFFPGSGLTVLNPFEWDEKIGEWLELPKKKWSANDKACWSVRLKVLYWGEEKYQGGTIVYDQGKFLFDLSESEFWQTGLLVQIGDDFEIFYIPFAKSGNCSQTL